MMNLPVLQQTHAYFHEIDTGRDEPDPSVTLSQSW
jgi:hypothetical protein